MEEVGLDLGLQRVVGTAHTELLACRRALRVGVAALNHEVANDAMEQRAIVIALRSQLQEVVAVNGCVVVEANGNVAQGSGNLDICHGFDMLVFYN